jgi:predicted nucleic acid-binding Zn ribbon protein
MIVGSSAGIIHSYAVTLTINPIATYLTIAVSPTEVKQTNTATVSGTISPKTAGAAVTLTYTKPDGTGLTKTVTTDTDGRFSDSFASEDMGSWQVYATWQGDQLHAGARSAVTTFQVTELSFIDRYGFALGAVVLIVLAAAAVLYFRSRRAMPPPSEKKPAPPSPPAPVVVEVPTPVIVEVPRPVVTERREAPPLILPRKSCFNCGEVISAQAKFCDKCRAPQPEKVEKKYEEPPLVIPRAYCSNCGEVISAQAAFCDKCRAPQT